MKIEYEIGDYVTRGTDILRIKELKKTGFRVTVVSSSHDTEGSEFFIGCRECRPYYTSFKKAEMLHVRRLQKNG